jgi:hypothetical protein
MSLLVSKATRRLNVEANRGDYPLEAVQDPHEREKTGLDAAAGLPIIMRILDF